MTDQEFARVREAHRLLVTKIHELDEKGLSDEAETLRQVIYRMAALANPLLDPPSASEVWKAEAEGRFADPARLKDQLMDVAETTIASL